MTQILKDYAKVIGISFCAAILLRIFALEPYSISSPAMKPALLPGDQILIFKTPYVFSSPIPNRGKIILVNPPNDPDHYYIRRVMGVPGDRIRVENGELFLNGKKIREDTSLPSVLTPCWRERVGNQTYEACQEHSDSLKFQETTIPPNMIFAISDYRTRLSGPFPSMSLIPIDRIRGEAKIIWLSIHPDRDSKAHLFSRLRFNRIFSKVGS